MNDVPASHLSEHRRLAAANHYASRVVANLLDQWFAPRSVLDLGCGNGVWMNGLRVGQREVLGVEFEQFTRDELEVEPELILRANLGKRVDLHRRFDMVMCLEVAEHIDAAFAETVVENCVRHAPIVLFSAAIPGQQGLEHINEQLPEYWAKLFAGNGYVPLDLIRPLIWDDPQIPVWYRQNLLLFVHRDEPALPRLQVEAAKSLASLPLNRAHPELMLWFSQDAQATHQANDALQHEFSDLRKSHDTVTAELRHFVSEVDRIRADRQQLDNERARLERECRQLAIEHGQLAEQHDRLRLSYDDLRVSHDQLWHYRETITRSTLWRVTAPLRSLLQLVPLPLRRGARAALNCRASLLRRMRVPSTAVAPQSIDPPAPSAAASAVQDTVIFISGEPHTPGHRYRVLRAVEAACALGLHAKWLTLEEALAHLYSLAGAVAVMIWRLPWSPQLEELISATRRGGAKIIYDIDDLMFLPELARVEIIDGIRSQQFEACSVAAMFANIRTALLASDICSCTTSEIAYEVRAYQKAAVVLPNGFDDALHRCSRTAVRKWQAEGSGGLLRMGYAAGSRTHQRDFGVAAVAVARVLRDRPNCRLVLFRAGQTPLIDIEEFPSLLPFAGQIEWRQMRAVEDLPQELVRFDINLAPLEVGNPFCEAKSELKYFEAALVDVPTVASPTGPFQRCMRDGVTGYFATTEDTWYDRLIELVDDGDLRRRIGHAAYHDILWTYGPQRRQERMALLLAQVRGGVNAARAIELDVLRTASRRGHPPEVPEFDTVFSRDRLGEAEVTVVMPLYNYSHYVVEALDSARFQTLGSLDLVVVDDASTDNSLAVARAWAESHAERFNRLLVLRHRKNSGLALTRNTAINAAETPFVFPLDADNRIRPECCAICIETLRSKTAAFAYPQIQYFGDADDVIGNPPFEPMRLAGGNYIDAMALVAKWAWAAVGGYSHLRHGWEDYDFWCNLVEHGCWGIAVPEILADYRVHRGSMLHTTTDVARNKRELIKELEQRHAWLEIPSRD